VRKKSVSDSYLEKLWREAVYLEWSGRCAFCGSMKDLQCHHFIRRHKRLTRYDWRNGVLLCKECHREAHTNKGMLKVLKLLPYADELLAYEQVTYKDWLAKEGLTDNEFRRMELEELKNKIKELKNKNIMEVVND